MSFLPSHTSSTRRDNSYNNKAPMSVRSLILLIMFGTASMVGRCFGRCLGIGERQHYTIVREAAECGI